MSVSQFVVILIGLVFVIGITSIVVSFFEKENNTTISYTKRVQIQPEPEPINSVSIIYNDTFDWVGK